MLQGGFVVFDRLTIEQRVHMMIAERANYVPYQMRQRRAENTDPEGASEQGEEEPPTSDPEDDRRMMWALAFAIRDRMRDEINRCLQPELFRDASEIQTRIMTLITAMSADEPEGLSERVVREARNIFQRLYRRSREVLDVLEMSWVRSHTWGTSTACFKWWGQIIEPCWEGTKSFSWNSSLWGGVQRSSAATSNKDGA